MGGARIFLKREDLNHTGAHKINNTVGQALLAKRMGKTRIIAETGAGQHGVASATVAARLGMECVVYMGEEDIRRQAINVYRMRLLGATVVSVSSGSKTLKDALNEAMRDWVTNVDNTFYIIGTVAGPHPYPAMVRDFQAVIGRETRQQMLEMTGQLPDVLVACVGGGSNAIGMFYPFINDTAVALHGVEAAGDGLDTGRHAAPLCAGKPGVLHGNRTYLMEDNDGQIIETHSISAGLDYPGVGPEHAWLKDTRARAVHGGHRQRGHAGVPPADPRRGHHAGAGVQPCNCPRREAGGRHGQGPDHRHQPVRSRRQGRAYGGHPGRHQDMSRIAACFARLRQQRRKALIPYVTAGDPLPTVTVPLLHALVGAGADLLEVGVPFSDPMADGPVIQAACERALEHHVTLHQVLDMVREFRRQDMSTPVILMGYLNPIEVWGYVDFAAAAAAAGVDGVLTVDMPPEEAGGLVDALRKHEH